MVEKTIKYESDLRCSHCKSENSIRYDYKEGSIVCESCGLIAERGFVDPTAEFRIFGDGGNSGVDPRRVGGPIDEGLTDGGLGVYVNQPKTRFTGKFSDSRQGISTDDKNYRTAMSKLRAWGQRMELHGDIIDEAINIFKQVRHATKLKGKRFETILASILYVACKKNDRQITPQTIENITEQPKDDLRKVFNVLKREIPEFTYTKPDKLVKPFCEQLGQEHEVIRNAEEIAKTIIHDGYIDGKNPRTVAAVSILIASTLTSIKNDKKTLKIKDISNVADIAENTIKQAFRDVQKQLSSILPETLKKIYDANPTAFNVL